MVFKKYLLLPLSVLLFLVSCTKTTDGPPQEKVSKQRHTLIMYMQGNNNLQSDLIANVNQVLSAVTPTFSDSANIYVFFEYKAKPATLYKVRKPSKSGAAAENIELKTYTEAGFNSTKPECMQEVLNDVLADEETPAEVYGLLVSSHGSGWLPSEYSVSAPRMPGIGRDTERNDGFRLLEETGLEKPANSGTKAVGESGNKWMDIDGLIAGMSPIHFDYLMFDACFMSSIEVLYDLRNSTDYVIASPVEILQGGFPMDMIVPILFSADNSLRGKLVKSADAFYSFYAGYSYPSGSIAVVDCAELGDFKDVVKDIYSSGINNVNPDWVQYLHRIAGGSYTFHDLDDYMYHATSRANLDRFRAAFKEMVLYSATTPQVYSAYNGRGYFNSNGRICGVSVFIPRTDGSFPLTTNAWKQTNWAKDIGVQ